MMMQMPLGMRSAQTCPAVDSFDGVPRLDGSASYHCRDSTEELPMSSRVRCQLRRVGRERVQRGRDETGGTGRGLALSVAGR